MATADTITSAANPMLKDVRRAVARGGLTHDGLLVAETFHLLEEALRSACEVKFVLAAESARRAAEDLVRRASGAKMIFLPDALLAKISGTETSPGVIALVRPPAWKLAQLFRGRPLLVILDGLQDPGNAGAIVRTAEAFGASGVLFLKGTVSPYNPKTLRASAGSLFRVRLVAGVDAAQARATLQENKVELYAAVPADSTVSGRPATQVDLTARCGLIIGNEARGVSSELRSAAQEISIPTEGVESLNAAIAAAVLLYEARRQRALRP